MGDLKICVTSFTVENITYINIIFWMARGPFERKQQWLAEKYERYE